MSIKMIISRSRMYVVVLLTTLTYLVTCSVGKDDVCDILKPWLLSTSISMEMNKKGFHRELVTTVKFGPDVPNGLKVMLIHRWPRGVYVDPYELASLRDHSDLEVLLDSTIDLEAPAHKSVGFVAFVYPSLDEQNPTLVEAVIPIHGRYHEPSYDGEQFVLVHLDVPELLLRTDTCSELSHFSSPHAVVEAPCTAENSSICQWVKIQHQGQDHASFQIPVGDGSLMTAVCAGTLVVTLMCCVALSKSIWKHGII